MSHKHPDPTTSWNWRWLYLEGKRDLGTPLKRAFLLALFITAQLFFSSSSFFFCTCLSLAYLTTPLNSICALYFKSIRYCYAIRFSYAAFFVRSAAFLLFHRLYLLVLQLCRLLFVTTSVLPFETNFRNGISSLCAK